MDNGLEKRRSGFEATERKYAMLEQLRDPAFLPTHADIEVAFGNTPSYSGEIWNTWYDFCFKGEYPVYEFLNREYIERLGSYLQERLASLGLDAGEEVVILEVGAGNGRLSHFLWEELQDECVTVVASDSGDWNLKSPFPVEKIDHKAALERYKPHIVIFSWMPYGYDCTDDFRAAPSVKEYLLIGEPEGGCCGDNWETWGQEPWDEEDRTSGVDYSKPLHEQDGFIKHELYDEMGNTQICRTDSPGDYYHSGTVAFRRN